MTDKLLYFCNNNMFKIKNMESLSLDLINFVKHINKLPTTLYLNILSFYFGEMINIKSKDELKLIQLSVIETGSDKLFYYLILQLKWKLSNYVLKQIVNNSFTNTMKLLYIQKDLSNEDIYDCLAIAFNEAKISILHVSFPFIIDKNLQLNNKYFQRRVLFGSFRNKDVNQMASLYGIEKELCI